MCDDYCNNHGCNRGPSCPAGAGCHSMPGCKDTHCPGHPGPARVAKIGRKEHGREPLRGSAWRRQLKYLATAMLGTLAVMLIAGATVALIPKKPASTCTALMKKPEVPAHIQIKCKEAA